MAAQRQHGRHMGTFLDKLSDEEQATLRAYARAQADAAPPLVAEQWAELYAILWPSAPGMSGAAPGLEQ